MNESTQFPKVYDLSYEYETPKGQVLIRLASDGKGKTLEEASGGNLLTRKVTNYPSKTIQTAFYAGKMTMNSVLAKDYEEPTDENINKQSTKYLGEKEILGWDCKGWYFENESGFSEMWVEKNDRIIVQHTSRIEDKTYVMTLVERRSREPDPELFELPSDFDEFSEPPMA